MSIYLPPSSSLSFLLKWVSWALVVVFCLFEFSLALYPGTISADLRSSFQHNAETIELILQFVFYFYIPTQLPIGNYLARSRYLLPALFFCALNILILCCATDQTLIVCLSLITGIGASISFIAILSLVTSSLPKLPLTMILNAIYASAIIGVAYSGSLGILDAILGNKLALLSLAITGLFLGLFILFLLPNTFHFTLPNFSRKQPFFSNGWKKFRIYWLAPRFWGKALMICLFYLITTSFGTPLGLTFFRHSHGLHRELAGFATSLIYIEWIFDRSFIGHLTDHLGFRRFFVMIGSLLGLLCLSPIISIPSLLFVFLSTLLFLVGLSSPVSSFSAFSLPNHFRSSRSLTDCVFPIGGAILQPFVGLMFDLFWGGGEPGYGSLDDPLPLLVLLPIGCLLACIIKKKSEKQVRKNNALIFSHV